MLTVTATVYGGPMPGFYSIHEINKMKPGSTYTTEGYVVYKYECPPCVPPNECKPCMGENVVISEKNNNLENYNGVGETELIIYAENTDKLELVKKYYFIVSIHGTDNPSSFRAQGGLWWQEGEQPPALGSGVSD